MKDYIECKLCKGCKVVHLRQDFFICKKGYLYTYCKFCTKIRNAAYHIKNKNKIATRIRAYQKNNPHIVKAALKKWRKNNKLKMAEHAKKSHANWLKKHGITKAKAYQCERYHIRTCFYNTELLELTKAHYNLYKEIKNEK